MKAIQLINLRRKTMSDWSSRKPRPRVIIESWDKLKEYARIKHINNTDDSKGGVDCYLSLAGGIIKSSKTIKYDSEYGSWLIYHWCSDTAEMYKTTEVLKEEYPLLGVLIENKGLILDD